MAPANTALLGRTGLYIHTQEAEGQQQRPRRGCPGLLGGRHRCSHKDRLCSAWPGHGTPAPAHTARLQSTGCASASDRNQLTRKPLAGARCGGVRSRSREMKNGQGGVYTPGTGCAWGRAPEKDRKHCSLPTSTSQVSSSPRQKPSGEGAGHKPSP